MKPHRLAVAALSLAAALPMAAAQGSARPLALPFIEDDYPKAMAQARSQKKPVFVEAWAPW